MLFFYIQQINEMDCLKKTFPAVDGIVTFINSLIFGDIEERTNVFFEMLPGNGKVLPEQFSQMAQPYSRVQIINCRLNLFYLSLDDPLVRIRHSKNPDRNPDLFQGTERFFRPGYAANLTSAWIPALDGLVGGAVLLCLAHQLGLVRFYVLSAVSVLAGGAARVAVHDSRLESRSQFVLLVGKPGGARACSGSAWR